MPDSKRSRSPAGCACRRFRASTSACNASNIVGVILILLQRKWRLSALICGTREFQAAVFLWKGQNVIAPLPNLFSNNAILPVSQNLAAGSLQFSFEGAVEDGGEQGIQFGGG